MSGEARRRYSPRRADEGLARTHPLMDVFGSALELILRYADATTEVVSARIVESTNRPLYPPRKKETVADTLHIRSIPGESLDHFLAQDETRKLLSEIEPIATVRILMEADDYFARSRRGVALFSDVVSHISASTGYDRGKIASILRRRYRSDPSYIWG